MVLTQPTLPTHSELPGLLVLIALVYLAPSIVAVAVSRQRSRAVLAVNLLVGWTLVGWAVSLAMALDRARSTTDRLDPRAREPHRRQPTAVSSQPPTRRHRERP
jgi:Superinfection immunity protein